MANLNPNSLVSRLFQDLKERLLKIGTIRGAYLIPIGVIGIWIVLTSFQYILHALAILAFAAAIVEGLYQLLHNPVKKEATLQKLVQIRNYFDEEVQLAEHEVQGFMTHILHLIEKKTGAKVAVLPLGGIPKKGPPPGEPDKIVPSSDSESGSTKQADTSETQESVSTTSSEEDNVSAVSTKPKVIVPTT